MIIYLVFLEIKDDGLSHGSIDGVSLSFKYAKETALKHYQADNNMITKKNGRKGPLFTPYIEMWDTSANRDGGDRIGRFYYNEELKIFEFEGDD
jgi:hypothetical protein